MSCQYYAMEQRLGLLLVNSLQKTQRAMERSILRLNLKDKVSNEEIRRRTKTVDVGYIIKSKKFKYAGHMIRGSNERWAKKVTEWLPYGNAGEGALHIKDPLFVAS